MTDVHGEPQQGGYLPAEIWHDYMAAVTEGQPCVRIPADPRNRSPTSRSSANSRAPAHAVRSRGELGQRKPLASRTAPRRQPRAQPAPARAPRAPTRTPGGDRQAAARRATAATRATPRRPTPTRHAPNRPRTGGAGAASADGVTRAKPARPPSGLAAPRAGSLSPDNRASDRSRTQRASGRTDGSTWQRRTRSNSRAR